jgi:hypothetical protein
MSEEQGSGGVARAGGFSKPLFANPNSPLQCVTKGLFDSPGTVEASPGQTGIPDTTMEQGNRTGDSAAPARHVPRAPGRS